MVKRMRSNDFIEIKPKKRRLYHRLQRVALMAEINGIYQALKVIEPYPDIFVELFSRPVKFYRKKLVSGKYRLIKRYTIRNKQESTYIEREQANDAIREIKSLKAEMESQVMFSMFETVQIR
jgi:hypothetical protein